jgi:hypothetical protein
MLKRKRQAAQAIETKRKSDALHAELARRSRGPVHDTITTDLAKVLRKDARPGEVADLLAKQAEGHHEHANNDNKGRAEERVSLKLKKKRTELASYQVPLMQRRLLKTKKWSAAARDLAPYIKEGTTDGLVLMAEGVGLSTAGTEHTLKKATLVHMFCALRLGGASTAGAIRTCTLVFPGYRMSGEATIYRYLHQYFTHKGFFETAVGKWARENIWSNPTLMYAMKTFIQRKMYNVVKESENPHDHKHFVAEHACQHLNKILLDTRRKSK